MSDRNEGLFDLLHDNESIGRSRLESGDPVAHTVSGIFFNVGGAKALANWIKSIGGSEEDGAVYVAIDDDFLLQDSEGQSVKFATGSLIALPNEDETFVEFSGISAIDYEKHFNNLIMALSKEDEQPKSDEG